MQPLRSLLPLSALPLAALLVPSPATAQCSVQNTIGVDANPNSIAVNTVTRKIYTKSWTNGTVSVVDASNGSFLMDISVTDEKGTVAVNSLTNRIYAASGTSAVIDVIDGASHTVTATISMSGTPGLISVDEGRRRVYASIPAQNEVAVINGNTNEVITTVPVGFQPNGIDVNNFANQIFVANAGESTVSVIDGASMTVITSVPVSVAPVSVIFDPVLYRAYVTDLVDSEITVIDANSLSVSGTLTPSASSSATDASLDPCTGTLYLSPFDTGANKLLPLNVASNIEGAPLTVSSGFGLVVPDPARSEIYFASFPNSTIEVVACSTAQNVTCLTERPTDPKLTDVGGDPNIGPTWNSAIEPFNVALDCSGVGSPGFYLLELRPGRLPAPRVTRWGTGYLVGVKVMFKMGMHSQSVVTWGPTPQGIIVPPDPAYLGTTYTVQGFCGGSPMGRISAALTQTVQ